MLHLHGPGTSDLSAFILTTGIVIFCMIVAELLVRYFSVSGFAVRKVMHAGSGILVFFMPWYFADSFYPVVTGILFLLVNVVGLSGDLLHCLGEGDGREDGERPASYGPVFVPLVFIVLVLLLWDTAPWIIQISILVMALGDSLAGVVGTASGGKHIENLTESRKTIEGSVTMFLVSIVVLVSGIFFFRDLFQGSLAAASTLELLALVLLLAVIVTAVEALFSHGLDNLFIPLSLAYTMYLLSFNPSVDISGFLTGGLMAFLLAVVSVNVKFLDNSGATATFLLGTTIFGIGGLVWTVPLLTFYLLSSVLSKLGRKRKARFDLVFEKGSQRDAGQVYANGGIAWLIMVMYSLTGDPGFFFAYLGTLAAVQSDTWATEIGTMWPNPKARLITTMRAVPVGTSGGVSLPGTFGAFAGALLICASALFMGVEWLYEFGVVRSFLLIGLSGLVASLVDSFFGATVQAQYYDPVREKVTERTVSFRNDGTIVKNKLIKGYHVVNNDLVNTMCAVSGSVLAYVFSQYFCEFC
ncbi:DUF92 domain-containing protein [Prosthecochloris sp. HL-130-GSB]|uniref:DUF92 domain-containing protein n=1 Tax=Prosthecochloris sp. HL-130-GSB TaxID=1974213 RepID=UPI000A1C00B5|nr:DUF92 domain-containing protein [Prosthecochloris sp. HL-130-GSB]ARM31201.1 hypothetical protein B9H02_07730 [Prosthecochloris sp. HL-130-GSB]